MTCGPRALAVVLTGKGNDGQAGIRAVAHCGGTVFAQGLASSAHTGMPHAATGTGIVRSVLALPDITAAICTHVAEHYPR